MNHNTQNTEPQSLEVSRPETFVDRQFANMSGCGLMLLLLFFPGLALCFGLVGLIVCKHPKARERSVTMLAIGAFLTLIGFLLIVVGLTAR